MFQKIENSTSTQILQKNNISKSNNVEKRIGLTNLSLTPESITYSNRTL